LKEHFAERDIRDAIVAPLYGDSGVMGMILVANRLGDVSTFGKEDVKLLETLANHASVSLENARLVGSLEHSLVRLTEMNQLKDDFVAAVSHELRTPLTSIQGYVKTLLRPDASFDANQERAFLKIIERQSDRLRHLIEDLLVASRLQSEAMHSAFTTFSLPALVRQVVDEFGERVRDYNVRIDFEEDVPFVMSDPVKMHQILSNLVDNAFKYSPEGSTVRIHGERRDDTVVVTIEDNGCGVPEELQQRIFDRFYQVDQSTTRKIGGTGLGLYICRKLADAVDGKVWLERSDENGSAFSMSVPYRPAGSSSIEPESKMDDPGTSIRVLGA
jgi:two-component system phosphate regulon sensor histidine kinase PhoR